MGLVMFYGCWLVAMGPLLALFLVLFRDKGPMIILSSGSCFFWLLSLLLSSIFWWAVPPLRDHLWWSLVFSVFFQEAMRMVFWKVYKFTERGLTGPVPQFASIQTMQAALATGMGTAAAHVLITYSSVLFDAVGPGALFAHSCPGISLFFLSALFALFFTVFHVASSVLAFDAYNNDSKLWMGIIFAAHLALAYASLFNVTALCGVSVLLGAGISAATAYFAVLSCQSTTSAWRRGAVNSSAYSEVPISAPTGEK